MNNMKKFITLISLGLGLVLAMTACSSTLGKVEELLSEPAADSAAAPPTPSDIDDYRIVTLLPKDAIPAIDSPQFLDAESADKEYAPDEEVLGVVFDGEARAYSVPLLSSHEIVNDTVAGRKIAVTW
jgi:hypothetical protein